MNYRSEIDGLRAVAVVAVMVYHADFGILNGGFFGVDIFFVISGFLITKKILEELEKKQFSFRNFYDRRARRILPALIFMMLVCLPFAWYVLLPNELKYFSRSLVAANFFIANFLFWTESGYFDTTSNLKPLIHTWSLSIEEQFYVLFPVLLVLIYKYRKKSLNIAISLGFALSLILAYWLSYTKPSAAFYLLPTRIWELLFGSILAATFQRDFCNTRMGFHKDFICLLAIVLLLYSLIYYSKGTPHPGVFTLIPVVGTGLLLTFATSQTTVGKLLASRPLVGIGLLSYSAYLFHQPIFVFARHIYPEISINLKITFIALTFFLAFLSWKYIETPSRRGQKKTARGFYKIIVFLTALIVLTGAFGWFNNGMLESSRWDEIRKFELTKMQKASGFHYCRSNSLKSKLSEGLICIVGDINTAPVGILWGDSYAGSALFGINNFLLRNKKSYIAILTDGCPPIPGLSRKDNSQGCTGIRHRQILEAVVSDESLQEIIWIGRLRDVVNPLGGSEFLIDGFEPSTESLRSNFSNLARSLTSAGRRLVVVLEGPNFAVNIPDYLSKSISMGISPDPNKIEVSRLAEESRSIVSKDFLETIPTVSYVDSLDLFCNKESCKALLENGWPVVVDQWHISHQASDKLAIAVFNVLSRAKGKALQE